MNKIWLQGSRLNTRDGGFDDVREEQHILNVVAPLPNVLKDPAAQISPFGVWVGWMEFSRMSCIYFTILKSG
jgi:hypothetical protein